MAAKTQDAAGEPATHQPPCPFAGTLRTYDWRERGCCCIEPATPRETALAAPTGETVPGLWDVMVSMALKPRQVCVSATDEAQVAALLAAPSAPQEPRGEPGEGMVESALNAMCGGILDSRRPWHTDERALMRKALAAALAGEGK